MLEIGPAKGQIGENEKGGLRSDAPHRVADGQIGTAGGRHEDRCHGAGERRARTEQCGPEDRLPQAGQVGEAIGDARHPRADDCDRDELTAKMMRVVGSESCPVSIIDRWPSVILWMRRPQASPRTRWT